MHQIKKCVTGNMPCFWSFYGERYLALETSNPSSCQPALYPPPSAHQTVVVQPREHILTQWCHMNLGVAT